MRFLFSLLATATLISLCPVSSQAQPAEDSADQEEVQLGTKWYEVTPDGLRLLKKKAPKTIPEDIRKSLLQRIDEFIKDEETALTRLASKAAPSELLHAIQSRITTAKRERIWLQLPETTRTLLAKQESLDDPGSDATDPAETRIKAQQEIQKQLQSNASKLNPDQQKLLSEWKDLWKSRSSGKTTTSN